MNMFKKNVYFRVIVVVLLFAIIVPATGNATNSMTDSPRASYYLDSYNAYVYNAAFGKIQVYFDVTGVNYMDEIGTLNIQIFESTDNKNWTWVETYTHDGTSGMLDFNDIYHSGHVNYQGTIGRYYKAYVCIWAGKDGDGDTRYMWTNVVKASLFAG